MSQPHTRKNFIAKVLGAVAATGLIVPRVFASSNPSPATAGSSAPGQAPFSVKTDPRSVARTGDVL